MKITRLTHSGLLFENANLKIAIDPREDSGSTGLSFLLEKSIDIILITHEHPGHLDMTTLREIVKNTDKSLLFLAPFNAYKKLKEMGGKHNYVMLNQHSVWSERGITFYAVHAEHSDRTAVGFIIDDGNSTYYASGDTLYNYEVIDDVLELVEDGVDCAFLPINGKNNNMNVKDAADFAYELGAKSAVPVHYEDDAEAEAFDFEDAVILEKFKTVEL